MEKVGLTYFKINLQ